METLAQFFHFPSVTAIVTIALASSLTSFAIFRGVLRYFPKFGLLDNPAPYGHKRAPVPFGVGIAFFANFALFALLLVPVMPESMHEKLYVLLALGTLVSAVSFLDDLDTIYKFDRDEKVGIVKKTAEELQGHARKTRFAVPAKVRLALQVFVGAVVGITSIKIGYVSGLFGGVVDLGDYYAVLGDFKVYLIPLLFTVVWYVLVFNSINWSDGVPGLTSGLVVISLIVIAVSTVRFYLADSTPQLRENSIFVLSILAVVLPTAAVAWYYNLAPKVLLGESGSMFASFLIASLAILVGGKVATVATVLGVYLVDAFYVIAARIYNGKSPLKGDRIHHLHYRLLNLGMSESFIRKFVYSISFLFGMAAVFLDRVGKMFLFVILVVVVFFVTKILSLKK